MGEVAVQNKPSLYTKQDLRFIARARSMLMFRHKMDDLRIAEAISAKKGWSQGSVEYQIEKMSRNGVGTNRYNRPSERIIGI